MTNKIPELERSEQKEKKTAKEEEKNTYVYMKKWCSQKKAKISYIFIIIF